MDLRNLQSNLTSYLEAVRIETDGPPQPFASVCDAWQMRDIDAIAPAVERLVREDAPEAERRRCWWVRPRAHSKTADAAMLVCWVLAFSPRRRRAVWVAADLQQGIEGLDSIGTLCRHNLWLDGLLTIRADKVENERTGSVMYFTTSDVSSAFGWKDCDLFCFDETTHWRHDGEKLWSAMYSAVGKRKNAVVFALMNAGHDSTWQQRLRDTAEADPNWAFSELPDAVASWIDPDQLADQAKYLPRIAFDRLWRNHWSSSAGDAISVADIERAFDSELSPMVGPERGYRFVLGCDLGLTRDFSACITLAIPSDSHGPDRIRLAAARLWRPPAKGKIDLLEIQGYILRQDEKFGLAAVALDAWQAEHLGQSLELASGHRRRSQPQTFYAKSWVKTIQPTTASLRTQAGLIIESFADDRFRFYDYAPLRNDLLSLRAVELPTGGFKLTSPRTAESGHGDSYSAFALSLTVGHEIAANRRRVAQVF